MSRGGLINVLTFALILLGSQTVFAQTPDQGAGTGPSQALDPPVRSTRPAKHAMPSRTPPAHVPVDQPTRSQSCQKQYSQNQYGAGCPKP